jgi:hypothetical protein
MVKVSSVGRWILCLMESFDGCFLEWQLDHLKRRGLLQDVDLASGEVRVHDLYREFAELEVRGKLDESTDLGKRRLGYVDDGDRSELESSPSVGLIHNLIRLLIQFGGSGFYIDCFEGINWQYWSNVVVLKLKGHVRWRGGVLSLGPLKCLRSFSLHEVIGLDRVEGLEGLKNLTYFNWENCSNRGIKRGMKAWTQMGRFPASLMVVEIWDSGVLFGPDVLARCTKLRTLKLSSVQAGTLDVSNCSSLQTLELEHVYDLRTLSGLTARWASGLKSLKVVACQNLGDIPGLEQLVGLEQLDFESCRSMAHLQLDLQKLTKLRALEIRDELFSSLCLPRQLRKLSLGPAWGSTPRGDEVGRLRVIEALRVNRLEQLEVLDLAWSDVSGLENVGGWPALRRLNLSNCWIFSRLPDLSQSTNLEELNLRGCRGELCEDDVCMLARLPQLQPVPIGWGGYVRFDLVRRKKLTYYSRLSAPRAWVDWKEHEWHERDLGIPPYRIRWEINYAFSCDSDSDMFHIKN